MGFKEAVYDNLSCAHSTKSVNSGVALATWSKCKEKGPLAACLGAPKATSYPHSQKAFFNVLNGDFRLVAAPLIILHTRCLLFLVRG